MPEKPTEAPTATRDMDDDGDIDAADTQAEVADITQSAKGVSKKMDGRITLDPDGVPLPLKWRPRLEWKAMLAGAVADVAIELALQQIGWIVLDRVDLIIGMVQGSILGAVAPMAGTLVGTLYVNQRISKLRSTA